MARSSRHKSSKRSSREGRDYSDSEKDSSLKERKVKEESASHRVSKESASGEKRKYDSKPVDGKDLAGSSNVDFLEEYAGSSSKKRKEKVDDDRWTGRDIDERESLKAEKNLKGLFDSKRSRKGDGISNLAIDLDEGKRSGGKFDAKHHLSEKKESEKEGVLDRDRNGKEYSVGERFLGSETGIDIAGGEGCKKQVGVSEERAGKHISSSSGVVSLDARRNPDHDRELERRFRKKDTSNDMDKYLDGREFDDRRFSSRNVVVKAGKYKGEGHEDDRYKDKYGEEEEKDSRFQDEMQQHRDGHHARDYVSSKSNEKYLRNEKKAMDAQQKKSKPKDSEHDHSRSRYIRHHDGCDRDDRNQDIDHDRDGDHDGGYDLDRDRGWDLDHDQGRERDRDRGRDFGRDRERGHGRKRYCRDRDRERARDRDFSHENGKERNHDHDRDYTSHLDDRSSRYKEDRTRRRSPDDYDDYYNDKARNARADAHTDREKSVSRRTHPDVVARTARGRTSPNSKSLMSMDRYRDNSHDDFRYGDSREVPATPDKSSKYLSSHKNAKDDNRVRDASTERSPRMRISPTRLLKSPSSTSIDRKYANRSGKRHSLDIDEAERRSSGSNDVRDGSINDDRQSKDLSSRKSIREEHSPAESSFHHKSSQGNGPFLGHGPPSYKAGGDSPSFLGSMGEDGRGHSTRYRRSVDPNMGRAHANPWKGVPNWPAPSQTGFMPFPPGPHGPPHGSFPPNLPQFPSPSMFSVRPPMEMNHSGIPYHLPDADRFTNHMRPLGWQNVVDGTGSSHFNGWDGNSGIFREEPPIYGQGNMLNGQVRETNADVWKPNGDVKLETDAKKDAYTTKEFTDEGHVAQVHFYSSQREDQGKNVPVKSSNGTPIKDASVAMTKVAADKGPESPAVDDGPNILRAYLSRLDISINLTKPELYNEFLSLAINEQSENVEEMKDVNVRIAKTVSSEITNATMDFSLLPAAEDSNFQRAMDLYKTHSTNRRCFPMFNGDESNSSEMKVIEEADGRENEQVVEKIDEPVHYQEIHGQPVEDLPAAIGQIEPMDTKTVPLTGGSDDVSDPSGCCEMEVKETTIMENMSPHKLSSKDVLNSNTDAAEIQVAEDEIGDNEPASCVVEQLGSEINGPLNLPHGFVKVCEGLMPVSNESESVTLTWVHHAPESTH